MIFDEARSALERWRLGPVISMERAASGTMNETYLVRTDDRRVVLRRHRRPEREQVAFEHDVIAFARDHDIPAPAAVPSPEGELIIDQDGVFYSLFEYAVGDQVGKDELTPDHAWAMGRTLVQLHECLADYPVPEGTHLNRSPDLDAVASKISSLISRIEERPAPTEQDGWALEHLRSKAAWLNAAPTVDWLPVPDHAVQLIHGDYQETNLFFVDHAVSAVIDWDKAEARWPVDEVIRTLDLAFRTDPVLCKPFVEGYRAVRPLPLDDLDHSANNWGFGRVHDHWLFEGVYLRGDDRLRVFLEPGPFIPFSDNWSRLRPALR